MEGKERALSPLSSPVPPSHQLGFLDVAAVILSSQPVSGGENAGFIAQILVQPLAGCVTFDK